MVKEIFDPGKGVWVPEEKIIEELEEKSKAGKLNTADAGKLAEIKKSRDFFKKNNIKENSSGPAPLPDDWRPGNYL